MKTTKCIICSDVTYKGNTCAYHYKRIKARPMIISTKSDNSVAPYAINYSNEDKIRQLRAEEWQAEHLDY